MTSFAGGGPSAVSLLGIGGGAGSGGGGGGGGPAFTSTYTTTGDGTSGGTAMRATGNYGATNPVFTVATGFSGNITVTVNNQSGSSGDDDQSLRILKNGSIAHTFEFPEGDNWGGSHSATITVSAGDTIGFSRTTGFIQPTYVEVQFQ
jgi:hypothetical protein